jgi:hypothetical protein
MVGDLFETEDPLGNIIRLTERCYRDHICLEHPDLADVEEIERAVRFPERIGQDALDPGRMTYYRTYQRNPQRWMIKVVVDDGEVVTAFRVKRPKQGENILWQR